MTDIHYFGRFPYDDLDLIAEALEILADERAMSADDREGSVADEHRKAAARADQLAGMAYAEQARRGGRTYPDDDPGPVAYLDRNRHVYCCVCGERPWNVDNVRPVMIDGPVAAAMSPAHKCHECGDPLVNDDEGTAA